MGRVIFSSLKQRMLVNFRSCLHYNKRMGSRGTGPSALPALVFSITTSQRELGWRMEAGLAGALRVQGSLLSGMQISGMTTQPRADCSSMSNSLSSSKSDWDTLLVSPVRHRAISEIGAGVYITKLRSRWALMQK